MAGPGQPHRLGAPAGADVEHAQPPADREEGGYLLVDLPGDELPTDGVPQPPGPARPLLCAAAEAGGVRGVTAQRFSPRFTFGLGSRRRRIWRVRISA
ncbi:hypothetical protein GCM10010315_56590 [Streptomyces luteosporeus]|uniref:Uncharacterized protein n=1 Tax=Streptomyces luteosporeus TaxID=173856 RepID=A0ABN3U6F4_9ACTN